MYIFCFSNLSLCRGGTDKREEALLFSGNNRDEFETVLNAILNDADVEPVRIQEAEIIWRESATL